MMTLTGKQLIGSSESHSGENTFTGIDPKTGKALPTAYHEASTSEIDQAIQLAEKAFVAYKKKTPTEIAAFLDQIAEEILQLGDTLIERAMAESALPQGRLQGERGRTMNQLKLFAKVVREGTWVDARIDHAIPDRQPFPKADIRHMLRPLGPVAIFGASNFPLAFSVAGGDTASALAAGCPVVIKGHPAHPGTSELVAKAIIAAAEKTNMPNGVCSLVHGKGHEVGTELVSHPLIQAVGFTGSYRGGKALFDLANKRAVPIPVFAEMGSTNPVFILPHAMKEKGNAIAEGLAGSITLGVGQFCTNPGLVAIPEGEASENFKTTLSQNISAGTAGTMLTGGIKDAFEKGANELSSAEGIKAIAQGQKNEELNGVSAHIFHTNYAQFKNNPSWAEEVFGPSSILIQSKSNEELLELAENLEGHLTATIHGTDTDLKHCQDLLDVLERKVGRLLINGYPTGVEVCDAMVHGGPFPATTAPQTTSVGTNAIKRFARPVCYQNFPQHLLPDALKDGNPLNIWRLEDGKLQQ